MTPTRRQLDTHTAKRQAEGDPRFQIRAGNTEARRAREAAEAAAPTKTSTLPLHDMVRKPLGSVDLDELAKQIAIEARPLRDGVSFTSRGRRYTFYWHRKGKRLAVKVGGLAYETKPVIEALAAKLSATRTCPDCGAAVSRRGKQRFCTPAHAARYRKQQWARRQRALDET